MGDNKMIVVFSGYNQRAVISFLRTLVTNKIKNYVIIAAGDKDPILQTRYNAGVFAIRRYIELNKEEISNIFKEIYAANKEPLFIAPSTEMLNRFLLKYRDDFEKLHCQIPIVKKELYEMISDKNSFWNLCKEAGIKVPSLTLNNKCFREPIVAKPKKYMSDSGKVYSPFLLMNEKEFNSFKTLLNENDFDFQQYIEGESYYLLYYFSKSGNVYALSQKNILQQPQGKSILAAYVAGIHLEDIAERYRQLFFRLGYRGLVMIELRKCKGSYYMIEANPRFWGPSQLFCDYGYNFFEFMLHDYDIIKEIPSHELKPEAKYFWSGGIGVSLNTCFKHIDYTHAFEDDLDKFRKWDIYNREDTQQIFAFEREANNMDKVEYLAKLYMENSKHSNYQTLPAKLQKILPNLVASSKWEKERMDYICAHVDLHKKRVLDIGGNTGYFTFESIDVGAEHVDYFEGNKNHAEFVKVASELLCVEDKISIYDDYFDFDNVSSRYDVILCLNVIHHLGDDFDQMDDMEHAKDKMKECITSILRISNIVVLQMGFNWCGNRDKCLFQRGTKDEMTAFIKNSIQNDGEVLFIGVAEKKGEEVIFSEFSDRNCMRHDEYGEFLNRPIFIIKSTKGNEK